MVNKGRQAKGTGNASTKLTPEQVEAIKGDTRTLKVISEELGVSKGLISYIKNGHRRSNG